MKRKLLVGLLFLLLLLKISSGDVIYPKNCPDSDGFQSFECNLDGWSGKYFERVKGRVCAGWYRLNDGSCGDCYPPSTQDTFWPVGGHHVRLRYYGPNENQDAYIERKISTKGYKDIKLKYARAVRDVEGDEGECLLVEYYNGTKWKPVPHSKFCGIYYYSDGWTMTKSLASHKDANDNENFKIRFRLTNVECDESAFIDRVKLEGTHCGTAGVECSGATDCCSGVCNEHCCKVGVECSGTACDGTRLRNKVCNRSGECVLDTNSEPGNDTDGDGVDAECGDNHPKDPCSITNVGDNCGGTGCETGSDYYCKKAECNHCSDGTQNCGESGVDCGTNVGCEACSTGYHVCWKCKGATPVSITCLADDQCGVESCAGYPYITQPSCTGTNDEPIAAFDYSPQTIYVGTPISFIDKSYDPDNPGGDGITRWQWNFGDGTSSTEQNPTHTYTSPGSYSVSLTVYDDDYPQKDGSTTKTITVLSGSGESSEWGSCYNDSNCKSGLMCCGGFCLSNCPLPECNSTTSQSMKQCNWTRGVCAFSSTICNFSTGSWGICNFTSYPDYEGQETKCDDGLDNDCDGYTDCNDTDCKSKDVCSKEVCTIGDTRPCPKQEGVCEGSFETCIQDATAESSMGHWSGCNYTQYSEHYEETETSCGDGLDNDCDGYTDCGDPARNIPPDPDCVKKPLDHPGCYNGDVYWYDSCGWPLKDNLIEDCDDGIACTKDGCKAGECHHIAIMECVNGDGCCPSQCTPENDSDCKECYSDAECEDGNACTTDRCVDGKCMNVWVECVGGDGCCPPNCDYASDKDCPQIVNNPPLVELLEPETKWYLVAGNKREIPVKFRAADSDSNTGELECTYELDNVSRTIKVKNGEIVLSELVVNWSNKSKMEEKTIVVNCSDGTSYSVNSSTFYLIGSQQDVVYRVKGGKGKKGVVEDLLNTIGVPEGVVEGLPAPVRENMDLIFSALVGLAFLILIIAIYLSRIKTREVIDRKLREEWEKEKVVTLKRLKKRRDEIRAKLSKIKKLEISGLSEELLKKKKAYENELILIQEDLLKNEIYLKELSDRADKAVEQAKKGVPSKEIMKQLVEEGYTKKEIEIIKKAFQRRLIKERFKNKFSDKEEKK